MRLLHTADWHLGRVFYGHHLTDDQAFVLEGQLFDIIQERAVEGLVIAGDIFDRPVPSLEALRLWDRILTHLAAMKVAVFVVAGNHDSAERLAAGRSFYEVEGVHIWGRPDQCRKPFIWTTAKGALAICPMPFAEPRAIYDALELADDLASHKNDINEMYHQWGQELLAQVPERMASLAISHVFVAGASGTGSERPLLVGGADYVQGGAFAGFTYTALGHIHRAQEAGLPSICYSGSPLKYSFDEASHHKSFTLIDLDEEGQLKIELIPVKGPRDLVVLKGDLEDLMNDKALQEKHGDDYILAQLTDQGPVVDGMARLRKAYPNALALELLAHKSEDLECPDLGNYRQLEPRALFQQFAESVWDKGLSEEEMAYMDEIWTSLEKEEL